MIQIQQNQCLVPKLTFKHLDKTLARAFENFALGAAIVEDDSPLDKEDLGYKISVSRKIACIVVHV